jgi:hypothetical protein
MVLHIELYQQHVLYISHKQSGFQTVTVTNQNPEVTTIWSMILDLIEAQNKEYFHLVLVIFRTYLQVTK